MLVLKYRRKTIYGNIGYIFRILCQLKKVNIVEAELCQDYVNMLVKMLPIISVSSIVGYLKRKMYFNDI